MIQLKINRLFRAVTAVITLFSFASTNLIAAPSIDASTPEVSLPVSVKLAHAAELKIPSQWATVEKYREGSAKTVFHVQSAHGHFQAEKNTEALLHYLEKNYGVSTILVEGSQDALNPEIINFYPKNREQNREITDNLTRHAVLKGFETYLLDSKNSKGYGIEDRETYNQGLSAFAAVIEGRMKSRRFLDAIDQGVERLAAIYFSPELRAFEKRVEKRIFSEVPLDVYLSGLKSAALKYLDTDLNDPAYQTMWPMLSRLSAIQKLESRIDAGSFSREKAAFLKAIKPYTEKSGVYRQIEELLGLKDLSVRLPSPETSSLFLNLISALPQNFSYDRFRSVTSFCGILILKSEISAETLLLEIEKLEGEIAASLSKTAEAKKLVSILKDYQLLKKLYALEILPREFDMIAESSDKNGSPSAIVKRLKSLNHNQKAKEVVFKNVDSLDKLYSLALDFYQIARKRDQIMLQRVEERLRETGADKVAVITGGFHAKPFDDYFSGRGYSYALLTPKITTADAEGRNDYVRMMMLFAGLDGVADAGQAAARAESSQQNSRNLTGLNPAEVDQVAEVLPFQIRMPRGRERTLHLASVGSPVSVGRGNISRGTFSVSSPAGSFGAASELRAGRAENRRPTVIELIRPSPIGSNGTIDSYTFSAMDKNVQRLFEYLELKGLSDEDMAGEVTFITRKSDEQLVAIEFSNSQKAFRINGYAGVLSAAQGETQNIQLDAPVFKFISTGLSAFINVVLPVDFEKFKEHALRLLEERLSYSASRAHTISFQINGKDAALKIEPAIRHVDFTDVEKQKVAGRLEALWKAFTGNENLDGKIHAILEVEPSGEGNIKVSVFRSELRRTSKTPTGSDVVLTSILVRPVVGKAARAELRAFDLDNTNEKNPSILKLTTAEGVKLKVTIRHFTQGTTSFQGGGGTQRTSGAPDANSTSVYFSVEEFTDGKWQLVKAEQDGGVAQLPLSQSGTTLDFQNVVFVSNGVSGFAGPLFRANASGNNPNADITLNVNGRKLKVSLGEAAAVRAAAGTVRISIDGMQSEDWAQSSLAVVVEKTEIESALKKLAQWGFDSEAASKEFFEKADAVRLQINGLRTEDLGYYTKQLTALYQLMMDAIVKNKNNSNFKIWTKPQNQIEAKLWVPTKQLSGLVPGVAMADRSKIREIEEQYAVLEKGFRITAYQRGADAGGSSIDLRALQFYLNAHGIHWMDDITSTTVISSQFGVQLDVSKAGSEDVNEYVIVSRKYDEATDTIISSEEKIVVKKGDPIPHDQNGQIKMKHAFAYILGHMYGVWGVKAKFETLDPVSEVGGFGRSGASIAMFMRAGAVISGIDLTDAEIQAEAIFLENEKFGGLTGGQETGSTLAGDPVQLGWQEFVRTLNGEFQFPGGMSLNFPVYDPSSGLTKQEFLDKVMEVIRFVQPGLEYIKHADGSVGPADTRTAGLINTIWTLMLKHPEGVKLHKEKTELANQALYGLMTGNFKMTIRALNRHRVIRNEIDKLAMRETFAYIRGERQTSDGELKDMYEALVALINGKSGQDSGILRSYMIRFFKEAGVEDLEDVEKGETSISDLVRSSRASAGQLAQAADHSLYSLTADSYIKRVEEFVKQKYGVRPDGTDYRASDIDFPIGMFLPGAGGPGTNVMVITESPEVMAEFEKFMQEQLGLRHFVNEASDEAAQMSAKEVIKIRTLGGMLQGIMKFRVGRPMEYAGLDEKYTPKQKDIFAAYDQTDGSIVVNDEDYDALAHLPKVRSQSGKTSAADQVMAEKAVSADQVYEVPVEEGTEIIVNGNKFVIAKISDTVKFSGVYPKGTRVEMKFAAPDQGRRKRAVISVPVNAGEWIFVQNSHSAFNVPGSIEAYQKSFPPSRIDLGPAVGGSIYTAEELKGRDYYSGAAATSPMPKNWRPATKNEIPDVNSFSEEQGADFESAGAESLLRGEGAFFRLWAGASSRQKPDQMPADLKAPYAQAGADLTVDSKAEVPFGFWNGRPVTYGEIDNWNLSRFFQQLQAAADAAGAGEGSRFDANLVLTMTNEGYRQGHLDLWARNNQFGLKPDQMIFFNQPLGPVYFAKPEVVERLYKAGELTAERYKKALALSQQAEQAYRDGRFKDLIIPGEGQAQGHGELSHQLIEQKLLVKLWDSKQKWMYIKNGENISAKYDGHFLRKLGYFLKGGEAGKGFDILLEGAANFRGHKGGKFYVTPEGRLKIVEDPNAKEGGADLSLPSHVNNAAAFVSLHYLISIYKQPEQSDEEFIEQLRAASPAEAAALAERGRSKFPKIWDEKKSLSTDAVYAKGETNFWMSTLVVPDDIRVGAIGVGGPLDFPIDQLVKGELSGEEQLAAVKYLQFLASKQWEVAGKKWDELKAGVQTALGGEVPSDARVGIMSESFRGNQPVYELLIKYIMAGQLVPEEIFKKRAEARSFKALTYGQFFLDAPGSLLRKLITDELAKDSKANHAIQFQLDRKDVAGAVKMVTASNFDRNVSLIAEKAIKIWESVSGKQQDFSGTITVAVEVLNANNQIVVNVITQRIALPVESSNPLTSEANEAVRADVLVVKGSLELKQFLDGLLPLQPQMQGHAFALPFEAAEDVQILITHTAKGSRFAAIRKSQHTVIFHETAKPLLDDMSRMLPAPASQPAAASQITLTAQPLTADLSKSGLEFDLEIKPKELILAKRSTAREPVTGKLFNPTVDLAALIRMTQGQNHSQRALSLLQQAQRSGTALSVRLPLRGLDGPGSSLDLPRFQVLLTQPGAKDLSGVTSTPTLASNFYVTVTISPAKDPDTVEYVAPDYGIPSDQPHVIKGDVVLGTDEKTSQKNGPQYIFSNLFKVRGVRIELEEMPVMAMAGGMESSNAFNVAVLAAASILSGVNLTWADIFQVAVELENTTFNGLTGGQGHLASILGGATRNVWTSGITDADGRRINSYGAFSIPFLDDAGIEFVEKRMALVQAGKKYSDGKPVVNRTAALINFMWTDLLEDGDVIGVHLHSQKLALAQAYVEALASRDMKTVIQTVNRYVDIRDELQRRWLRLAMHPETAVEMTKREMADASISTEGLDEAKIRQNAEKYAQLFNGAGKLSKEDPYYALYQYHQRFGDSLDQVSLYTQSLNPESDEDGRKLINAAREKGIAIMPLGAGGPSANMIAIAENEGDLEAFFQGYGLPVFDEAVSRQIVRGEILGEQTLKGYLPFKVGMQGVSFNGFDALQGVQMPGAPAAVTYKPGSDVVTITARAELRNAPESARPVDERVIRTLTFTFTAGVVAGPVGAAGYVTVEAAEGLLAANGITLAQPVTAESAAMQDQLREAYSGAAGYNSNFSAPIRAAVSALSMKGIAPVLGWSEADILKFAGKNPQALMAIISALHELGFKAPVLNVLASDPEFLQQQILNALLNGNVRKPAEWSNRAALSKALKEVFGFVDAAQWQDIVKDKKTAVAVIDLGSAEALAVPGQSIFTLALDAKSSLDFWAANLAVKKMLEGLASAVGADAQVQPELLLQVLRQVFQVNAKAGKWHATIADQIMLRAAVEMLIRTMA